MSLAYVVMAIVAMAANAGMALADLNRARFVLANSAEVGVPTSWLPALAILKLAGATGLLLGLLGLHPVGVAAAMGLVLFYAGACLTHIRARVFYNIAFPGGFLALATGTLILTLMR